VVDGKATIYAKSLTVEFPLLLKRSIVFTLYFGEGPSVGAGENRVNLAWEKLNLLKSNGRTGA
jgi:hypothetical protein